VRTGYEYHVPDQRGEHDLQVPVPVRGALQLTGQVDAPPVPHRERHDHEHRGQRARPRASARTGGDAAPRRVDHVVVCIAVAAEPPRQRVEVMPERARRADGRHDERGNAAYCGHFVRTAVPNRWL